MKLHLLKNKIVWLGAVSWVLYNFIAILIADDWLYSLNDLSSYSRLRFNIWGYLYFILGPIVSATIFNLSITKKLLSIQWKCSVGITILWACFCFAANPDTSLDSNYLCSYLALPMLYYVAFWFLYWIFVDKLRVFNTPVSSYDIGGHASSGNYPK